MIVLTDENGLILYVLPDSVTLTNDNNHTVVFCQEQNFCFKFGRTDPIVIYRNVDVAPEVKPQGYYFDGVSFIINPDYIEPVPIPYPPE